MPRLTFCLRSWEIVGLNNDDILIKQCKTALLLIKSLGYSLSNVFGHGEVSTNKQATEGKKCKTYATKYWDTPEDELPGGNDKEDKEDEDKKDNVTTTTTDTSKSSTNDEVDVEDNTNVTTSTTTEKGSFLDFFKNLGGVLKKKEDLKIEEDVQRIKNLLK